MLSFFLYIIILLFTVVYFVIFAVCFVATAPFDRKRTVIHHMSRFWTACYFRMVPTWKFEVEGLENIRENTPYVVIVNHRSMIDILIMYILPLYFKWVSKKEVLKWPIIGWVMPMHGDITIDRGTAGGVRKMVREGKKWLSDGVSVIIFPEGSRNQTEKVERFREGAFVMAQSAGVGILPCVTTGTDTALAGRKINFRNVFRVKVLPPLSAEEVQAVSAKELAERMHGLISTEYDKLKSK